MIVLGLTGSIGMGKSAVARQLRTLGVAVLDSDAVVHQLLGKGGAAVARVALHFPEALEKGAINRVLLGKEVFKNPEKLNVLEGILHPLVRHAQEVFIRSGRMQHRRLIVLEIPLLFETRAEERCDAVMVVTAPAFLQRQRVLTRAGMTEEKFLRIKALQMPDDEKRLRADFIVQTGQGYYTSMKTVKKIVRQCKS